MIRVTGLVKSHGTLKVLQGATLTANPGELTCLIGPSGGGKSTLLRCINGLETFDRGTIEVFGHTLSPGKNPDAKTIRTIRQKVGMVFQQFHLFPHLTVLQNVMSGPIHSLGIPQVEAEERAKRVLTQVGLDDKFDQKPSKLSGGQQQRVAIARALAVQPLAILFDEPTSALDPTMVGEVLEVMRALAATGQTMIVVTHDMDLAKQANVVHRMVAGTVAQSGTPSEILN
jgi:ABC-type polar amino acid transport system ATPase subunit